MATALLAWMWLGLAVHAAAADSKEALYLRATSLYQKQQFAKAAPLLRRLLPLFAKAQRAEQKGSQSWHQLTLAQCDILVRLGAIAWRRRQRRRACRLHLRVDGLRKTLPPQWKTWTAHTGLPVRVQAALAQLKGSCRRVPTVIQIAVVPKRARLSYREGGGAWTQATGHTLRTNASRLSVRAVAPGYQARTIGPREVPRWRALSWSLQLKPAPKPRRPPPVRPRRRRPVVAVRRPPPRRLPPPRPFYKTWWFWTITGVVIAGGTTAAIVAATRPTDFVLRGNSQDRPHRLW